MFDNIQDFYAQAKRARTEFNNFINEHKLAPLVTADHICYTCSSASIFEQIRTVLEKESEWFYQTIISKRRIATIKTKQCLETSAGNISLIELSDQKPDGSQSDRFHHIEIYPSSKTYEELLTYMQNQGISITENARPHHTTHDIQLNGLVIMLTRLSLADKIKQEQMEH